MKRTAFGVALICAAVAPAWAGDLMDADGYPVFYLRGEMNSTQWGVDDSYKFTREGDGFTLHVDRLDGEFKISGTEWEYNFGSADMNTMEITGSTSFMAKANAPNLVARGLEDVTLTFRFRRDGSDAAGTMLYITANGMEIVGPNEVTGLSGTLPVLYINVYGADGVSYDNEVIDRNLSHKEYFEGEYWLDLNGCEWLEAEGAQSIASADEPLPLQIKARGNFTRRAFSKKPYKLKLDKKQSMLGMTKSKHFALLAHADDTFGYMRNFTGFNLGERIGLPWTPSQQPVEVVINGDYRGLYFLTESIRVEEDRVNITELEDNAEDPALISGGYLVELDNYDEDNQIRMEEKGCVPGYRDMLRITWDTPEEYSDLQRLFVTGQFESMNDAVGANDDILWSYMDMDDAVRYYIVEEILSHIESYHGSTYLYRDFGEGQKWHFSPLWDFGNAFNGPTDDYLYNHGMYGNTWIASIRCNEAFNARLHDTWMWFMSNRYDGIEDDMRVYASHLKEAAVADRLRWKDAPLPDAEVVQPVCDNTDMERGLNEAINHMRAKTEWLRWRFGDYTQGVYSEPARDTTPAAPLPDFVQTGIEDAVAGWSPSADARWYTLQGMEVTAPEPGGIYIVVSGERAVKVRL